MVYESPVLLYFTVCVSVLQDVLITVVYESPVLLYFTVCVSVLQDVLQWCTSRQFLCILQSVCFCVAGCVTVAHESPVLLLEAAPVVVGAGPEEADLRREPRDDGRTDAQHDQPLVRRGTGRRQCEYLSHTDHKGGISFDKYSADTDMLIHEGTKAGCLCGCQYLIRRALWLIYIARDGLRYGLGFGFLSYAEIGSRDSESESEPLPYLASLEAMAFLG